MAQEWAAELYAISRDDRLSELARARRAMAFAVSLACSRPPTDGTVPGTAVGRVLKMQWKPVATLVLAPGALLIANIVMFFCVVVPALMLLRNPSSAEPWWVTIMPALAGVPVIAVAWYAGRFCGRRFTDRPLAASPGIRAVWVALLLGASMMAMHGTMLGAFLKGGYLVATGVAAAVWTVGIALVGGVAGRRLHAGRRRGTTGVAVLGLLFVAYLTGTAFLLTWLVPYDATLAYTPLWFPASLLSLPPDAPLGYTTNAGTVAFVIADDVGFYPYLLLEVGAFGLAYLTATQSCGVQREVRPAW